MKHVRTILLLLIMLVLVVVSVVNRQTVLVDLWPFPFETPMPLFLVFFIGIFIGLLLAAFYMAIRNAKHSLEMRKAKKESDRLASNVENLEQELDRKPPKVERKDYSEEGPGSVKRITADGDEK